MRTLLLLTALLFPGAEPVTVLQHDFRGGQLPEEVFSFFGTNAKSYVKPDRDGLRIVLPTKDKPIGMVGVACSPQIQGNFEVTIGYEILQVEKPKGGFGSGPTLSVVAETPKSDTGSIAHRVPPIQGDIYGTDRAVLNPEHHESRQFPAPSRKGQLRLTRIGSELRYLALAEPETEFQVLRREETFGDAPLKTIRITASTGGGVGPLDVRITDLTIRTGQIEVASAANASTKSNRPQGLILVLSVTGIAFLLAAFILGLTLKRKRLTAAGQAKP